MARRCLLLGMLSAVLGLQLRLPPALKSKVLPTRRGITCNQVSSSTSTMEEEEAPTAQPHGESTYAGHVDWGKQWYPVLAEKNTDTGRAHAVELLGKHLVVWCDDKGEWATFDDRCPHRAAPLTEGRVEKDGSLSCAYHGWRFDSDGSCSHIPQSENNGRDSAQVAACPKVYPTQVVQGLIWVWGENGQDSGLESALSPLPLIPELGDTEGLESGRVTACPFYQRDLPYSWETFLENVMDPSHAAISHHGIIGERDMAGPVTIELETLGLRKDGFSFLCSSPFIGPAVGGSLKFFAPCLVILDTDIEDGSVLKFGLYGVPTRPGWCRVICCQMFIAPKEGNTEAKRVIRIPGGIKPSHIPDWLQHMFGHKFFNQDMVLLHSQEKILASAGYSSSNYTRAVFTPTGADKGILSMRRWIATYAPDGPSWGEGCDGGMPPRQRNRDELFDIYEQHTKGCTSCLGALRRVNQLLQVARASSAASFGWAILRGASAVSISPSAPVLSVRTVRAMLPGLVILVSSLGSIKVLEMIHKSFHTSRFHHQDNN